MRRTNEQEVDPRTPDPLKQDQRKEALRKMLLAGGAAAGTVAVVRALKG